MPAVPIIAAVTGASAAVGATVAAAVGLGTVGTVAATAIGTGIIAGATTAVMGGDASDVLKSSVTAGVTSFVGGSLVPEIASTVTEVTGSPIVGQAVASGVMAEATGGDFTEGALLGGISGAANEAKLQAAEEYLKSQPVATTYESDLPTLNVTPGDTVGIVDQPYVPDTSFTADYSLSPTSPVIPEMGAQGIQAPTINEVIDVVNQPVNYSLPIPDSGLGLVMPTVPNIDSMGGGQGITIPVSDGTVTETGVIPESYTPVLGDETSFINQPVPDSGVTIPEVVETPMTTDELLSKMTMADLVKTLGVTAASAYMADKYGQPTQEEQITGFGIVPIPSEWGSPVYNQAFTPSAPIDFGSSELLKGTQWENPINLSGLINILNRPMQVQGYEQPVVQMPTVGMTDIIGNLGGSPVSIADIISGIQSGQNYSS